MSWIFYLYYFVDIFVLSLIWKHSMTDKSPLWSKETLFIIVQLVVENCIRSILIAALVAYLISLAGLFLSSYVTCFP